MKELLDRGANIDTTDTTSQTALHLAAQCGYLDVVKVLLGKGASINAVDCMSRTALHSTCAAEHGHTEVVKLLLGSGASIEAITVLRSAVTDRGAHSMGLPTPRRGTKKKPAAHNGEGTMAGPGRQDMGPERRRGRTRGGG